MMLSQFNNPCTSSGFADTSVEKFHKHLQRSPSPTSQVSEILGTSYKNWLKDLEQQVTVKASTLVVEQQPLISEKQRGGGDLRIRIKRFFWRMFFVSHLQAVKLQRQPVEKNPIYVTKVKGCNCGRCRQEFYSVLEKKFVDYNVHVFGSKKCRAVPAYCHDFVCINWE